MTGTYIDAEGSISAPHILVVEDDPHVREVLEIYLTGEGYTVSLATDGQEMRDAMARTPAQLVLMDLKLPGEDGFALTRYLREQYNVGIIILTTRHQTVDRVVGLECGADDYVTKPFEERELLARIRSVLRRSEAMSTPAQSAVKKSNSTTTSNKPIHFHNRVLDERKGLLAMPSGNEVELTGNECRLLAYLAQNAGEPQSRENLMAEVLNRAWDPMDRSIDVLVTRLRQKIESDPKNPAIIKTVRGIGYVISPESKSESSYNAA